MIRSYSIPAVVGRNIRRLRLNRLQSQESLAAALGLSRPIMSNIERGIRPVTLEELFALADIFHVSVDKALLDGLVTAPPFPKRRPR